MRLFPLLFCFCILSAACPSDAEPEPLTEVLVQVFADAEVQQAGDTLIVEFMSGPKGGELTPSDPETFDVSTSDFHWPVSMALVAKSSHEGYLFELNLRLEKQGDVVARGRVQSAFVKGQIVVLQTTLSAECLGKLDCPENETCVVNNGRATCQSAAVDSGKLPGVKDAPKSNDAGTAPLDGGPNTTYSDAGKPPTDAGVSQHDAGAQHDAAAGGTGALDAGSCIPSGNGEDCTNGIDDDCNGLADCADSACQEITACVPNAIAFALVDQGGACPDGYDFFDFVFNELQDPGCAGCSCRPVAKECAAYVAVYADATVCSRDVSPYTGGMELKDPATTTCSVPIGKQIDLSTEIVGFRVAVKASEDACTLSGSAFPQPPYWNVKKKRCSIQLQRNGCKFGSFCAPIQKVPQLCWQAPTGGCGIPELGRTYFQAFDDRRSCTACECTAKNGSCKDVGAALTTDTTCNLGSGPVVYDGDKYCDKSMPYPADAYARMVGKPQNPVCYTSTSEQGTLSPKAPVNLCCGP